MADEAILAAARELEARSKRADADVQHERDLMSACVATARTTATMIDDSAAEARRHADEMARQLTADGTATAAVMKTSAAIERMAAAALTMSETARLPFEPPRAAQRPDVVPDLPSSRGDTGKRIREHALPTPSPLWSELSKDERDLNEELALAAAEVEAIAPKETTTPARADVQPQRGTKETA